MIVARTIRTEKRKKGRDHIRKEEIKLCPSSDNIIFYIENLIEITYTKKLVINNNQIQQVYRVSDQYTNINCTSNGQSKNEIKKAIPYTIA